MIYDSFVTLVLVLLFLFIFRIKDSGIRILFFFLPIIKPLLIITERFEPHPTYINTQPVNFYFRIPNPANIFSRFDDFDIGNKFVSDINYLLIFIVTLIILATLIIRWINLYLFYRKLAFEEKVSRDDVPAIYDIMDKFAGRTAIKTPHVSLTHRKHISPFVVGIKNVTLVMCPNLLEMLNQPEKETVIYHELSHVKRKDNLISWVAMILRDLLFFNPFGHIAYFLIRAEQDSGSDKMVVMYLDRPKKEIAKSLLGTIMKLKSAGLGGPVVGPAQALSPNPGKFFSQHRLKNRIRSILRIDQNRISMRVFPRILMFILFFLILALQIFVLITTDNFQMYLR